jgi:hypothetical protein
MVTEVCKAGARYETDIAGADNYDAHGCYPLVMLMMTLGSLARVSQNSAIAGMQSMPPSKKTTPTDACVKDEPQNYPSGAQRITSIIGIFLPGVHRNAYTYMIGRGSHATAAEMVGCYPINGSFLCYRLRTSCNSTKVLQPQINHQATGRRGDGEGTGSYRATSFPMASLF